MKFKKLFLVLLCLGLFMTGCDKDKPSNDSENLSYTYKVNPDSERIATEFGMNIFNDSNIAVADASDYVEPGSRVEEFLNDKREISMFIDSLTPSEIVYESIEVSDVRSKRREDGLDEVNFLVSVGATENGYENGRLDSFRVIVNPDTKKVVAALSTEFSCQMLLSENSGLQMPLKLDWQLDPKLDKPYDMDKAKKNARVEMDKRYGVFLEKMDDPKYIAESFVMDYYSDYKVFKRTDSYYGYGKLVESNTRVLQWMRDRDTVRLLHDIKHDSNNRVLSDHIKDVEVINMDNGIDEVRFTIDHKYLDGGSIEYKEVLYRVLVDTEKKNVVACMSNDESTRTLLGTHAMKYEDLDYSWQLDESLPMPYDIELYEKELEVELDKNFGKKH